MIIEGKKIQLIAYDFDGVMTDNRVLVMEDGSEGVFCNRSDGLAVETFRNNGVGQLIISKERNKVVKARADKLQIPVLSGIDDKQEMLAAYCRENDIAVESVLYVGNDLNDLEVMKMVGYPVCPSDACKEVIGISKIVTNAKGGFGVIRELLEYVELTKEENGVCKSL